MEVHARYSVLSSSHPKKRSSSKHFILTKCSDYKFIVYMSAYHSVNSYDHNMGQPVTVIQKSVSKPGVLRFEINRSITGMDHERYSIEQEILGERPPDQLAKALFNLGGIEKIHMNSNVITIDQAKGQINPADIAKTITEMFTYYLPGVEVPSFESATEG